MSMNPAGGYLGAVACGHPETAAAAVEILEDGGNAFDAALAALCAACLAEPVLASLGGGGFLLAAPAHGDAVVYDFFCQTPRRAPDAAKLEFYPIGADFGTAVQEFHIGRGSVAVPGVVAGIFAVHRERCTLPLHRIIQPALRLARDGVILNDFQASVFGIVEPIFRATSSARDCFRSDENHHGLPSAGERLRNAAFGDTLRALSDEGADYFYRGPIARQIVEFGRNGGLLTGEDLRNYRVERRKPLQFAHHGVQVLTNPAPASGGLLIAFGLQLLQRLKPDGNHWQRLAAALDATDRARADIGLDEVTTALLDPGLLARYADEIRSRPACHRGTTQISVIDRDGNEASLTVSNGEGCGEVLADTGIMLNNMLGEEDLNRAGFHQWQPATRMTSMMAPTLLHFPDQRRVVLGSGGSNRIRSAILQVIVNLVDRRMPLAEAIRAPRLHVENNLLSFEPGLADAERQALLAGWPRHHAWQQQSLFFGGVHAVASGPDGLTGSGDGRRSGVAAVVREAR